MKRIVVVTALLLAAAAPARADDRNVVHFKLLPQSAVEFGDPTLACPAGTKRIEISSPAGWVLGTQFVCTQTATWTDAQTLVEVNTVIWDFGDGHTLSAYATATFSFANDFMTADFTASGTITGGEGTYEGAAGRLKAQGPVVFDDQFMPHLNVNSIIHLREELGDD